MIFPICATIARALFAMTSEKAMKGPGRNPVARPCCRCTSLALRRKKATAVGNYAIQIEFSDGHATGIYSFEHLREICPCEECGREFRGAAGVAEKTDA